MPGVVGGSGPVAGVSWSLAAGDGVQLAADAGGTAPTHDAKAEKTGVGKKGKTTFGGKNMKTWI